MTRIWKTENKRENKKKRKKERRVGTQRGEHESCESGQGRNKRLEPETRLVEIGEE
jgi:hypothetical protein